MASEMNQTLVAAAICIALYLLGFRTLAIGIFIISIIIQVVTGEGKPSKGAAMGGLKIEGAEMLEPIIIETTRGAPFRINKKLEMRVKPASRSAPWFQRAARLSIGGAANVLARSLFGKR